MCVFTQPVEHVSGTRIFARALEGAEQVLVYSMTVGASTDLAMVLPLPVPKGVREDAVSFVDLSAYPHFFADVDRAFAPPPPQSDELSLSAPISGSAPLVVHDVGDFEASFVPTVADFDRLDARFVLPPALRRVSAMTDRGFAVFKLKGFDAGARTKAVHPMAFTFPRDDPRSLFFPTLHVHDGKVRWLARFDHHLYLQAPDAAPLGEGWSRSHGPARWTVDRHRTKDTIDPDAYLHKRTIVGSRWNRDVLVPVA